MKKIIYLLLCFSMLFSSGCNESELETYKIIPSTLNKIIEKYDAESEKLCYFNDALEDKELTSYTLLDLGDLSNEIDVCINTYVYNNG